MLTGFNGKIKNAFTDFELYNNFHLGLVVQQIGRIECIGILKKHEKNSHSIVI